MPREVRFSLLDGPASAGDAPVQSAAADGARTQAIYERTGVLRISLCGPPAADGEGARTFLFEFPAREPAAVR